MLTTDGITEAMDGSDEMFGRDRLKQSLLKNAKRTAQEILEGVLADVAAFCGGAPQKGRCDPGDRETELSGLGRRLYEPALSSAPRCLRVPGQKRGGYFFLEAGSAP